MLFQGTRPGSICKSQHPQIIVKQERESGMSIHKVNQKLFAVVDNVGKFVVVIGTYEQCKCYIDEVEGS